MTTHKKKAWLWCLILSLLFAWAGVTRLRLRSIADSAMRDSINSSHDETMQKYSLGSYPCKRIDLSFEILPGGPAYNRFLPHWDVRYEFPEECSIRSSTVIVPIFALKHAVGSIIAGRVGQTVIAPSETQIPRVTH